MRQRKQIELMCNQRKQFLSKIYDEIQVSQDIKKIFNTEFCICMFTTLNVNLNYISIQVIQEAYKIGLSESNDLSSDPSKKEENILYAELKTEFKQQEKICNILSQITVHEKEFELDEELKAIVAESARKWSLLLFKLKLFCKK